MVRTDGITRARLAGRVLLAAALLVVAPGGYSDPPSTPVDAAPPGAVPVGAVFDTAF